MNAKRLGIGLLIALGAFVLFYKSGDKTEKLIKPKVFLADAGTALYPSFSPDGQKLVYSGRNEKDAHFRLYVAPVKGGAPRAITDSGADDLFPVWSPDGSRIAFTRGSECLTVSADGGGQQSAGTAPEPDGDRLPAAGWVGSQAVCASGGDWSPSGSPDGKQRAFVRRVSPGHEDLYVAPASGGEARRVTFDDAPIHGLAWHGSDLLYASERRHRGSKLWKVSSFGGSPVQIIDAGGNVHWPALSPDGKRLAFASTQQTTSIWRLTLGGKAESFINSLHSDRGAQYSPDGKKVAFISDRTGDQQLWVCDAEGNQAEAWTTLKGARLGSPQWAPDGVRIALAVTNDENTHLQIAAKGKALETAFGPIDESPERFNPVWSKDGKTLYYIKNGHEIWKWSGGKAELLVSHPAWAMTRNPAGDGLVIQTGGRLMLQPYSGERAKPIMGGIPGRGSAYFTTAGRKVYFLDGATVRTVEVESGKVGIAGDLPVARAGGVGTFAVSPDEKYVLFPRAEQMRAQLMTLEGWR